MTNIVNLGDFDKKIYEWVHEDPPNTEKIGKRALIVAVSPLYLEGLIALIIIELIKIGGGL